MTKSRGVRKPRAQKLDDTALVTVHLLDRSTGSELLTYCGEPITRANEKRLITYTMDRVTFRRAPKRCGACEQMGQR
jgi:hypothetical protein